MIVSEALREINYSFSVHNPRNCLVLGCALAAIASQTPVTAIVAAGTIGLAKYLAYWRTCEKTPVEPETGRDDPRIAQILEGRLDDSECEIERVKNLAGIDEKAFGEVQDFTNKYYLGSHAKTLFCQAMAIKQYFPDCYHFMHGQSSNWMRFIFLMNALVRRKHPELDTRQYQFLRLPETPGSIYRYSQSKDTNDTEANAKRHLICVSSDLLYTHSGESWWGYANHSLNNTRDLRSIHQACREAIQYYFPRLHPEEVHKMVLKINFLFFSQKEKIGKGGNACLFCIPKKGAERVYYPSGPFGKHIRFSGGIDDRRSSCSPLFQGYPEGYQGRIFAPCLDPKVHRIFLLTRVSPMICQKLEEGVKEIVAEAEATESSRSLCTYLFQKACRSLRFPS